MSIDPEIGSAMYSRESEYHQRFIQNCDLLPEELKTTHSDHILVWAHEQRLFDAGKGGGDGSADLVTIDEHGMVWLIEAKVAGNTELGPLIWGQLARYRIALMTMPIAATHRYCRSYLRGHQRSEEGERCLPHPNIFSNCDSIEEVFEKWHSHIGRAILKPATLCDRLANQLISGHFGVAVLADIYTESVVQAGDEFEHSGPLAYIQAIPAGGKLDMCCRWLKHPATETVQHATERHYDFQRFDDYEKWIRQHKCSPATIAEALCPESRMLWDDILKPGLIELGWDGKTDAQPSVPSSITVPFPIGSNQVTLLGVGWSSADAKQIDRERKIPGSAGLKVDINFYLCREMEFAQQAHFEPWARRFYDLGWRAMGNGKKLGCGTVSPEAYEKWGRAMNYKPGNGRQDFVGADGEAEVMRDFLKLLGEFLKSIRQVVE